MKVFIIGITGLLGSEGAFALTKAGHTVSGLTLPTYPNSLVFPESVTLHTGNYLTMRDDELKTLLTGQDALIFAAGIDERVKTPPPALRTFQKYNVTPLARILTIAKEVGVTHTVILGSYFTYFDRTKPALKLKETHPYIRSRVEQQTLAFSFASPTFDVAVLELPYIFGVQAGRKPVWTFLIEMLLKMKGATYYPRGGSAMITARQVGEVIAGALLTNKGANAYPVATQNVTWKTMLQAMHEALGMPHRKIIVVPRFIYRIVMARMYQKDLKRGYEGGLKLGKFSKMHASNQFMPLDVAKTLGATSDDLFAAIKASTTASYAVLNSQETFVAMEIDKK